MTSIARCEATGDRLHHCAALNDRMWVWIKRDDLDRAIDDQRGATELARSLGHAHLERCGTYNLAELLHWRGCTDEALPFARRSRSLQTRFLGPSPLDALLVARIQAGARRARRGRRRARVGRRALRRARRVERDAARVLGLVVARSTDRAAWEHAIAEARAQQTYSTSCPRRSGSLLGSQLTPPSQALMGKGHQVVSLFVALAGAGCMEEQVATTEQPAISVNAIAVNAIAVNAIAVNAINSGAIVPARFRQGPDTSRTRGSRSRSRIRSRACS